MSVVQNFDDRRRRIVFITFICITLGTYSVESAVQTKIWSEQSRISQSFLQQVKEKNLNKIKTFYFANVPFGYKSAFLFTFDSLGDAIYLKYGHRPGLRILSYVNLRDCLNLTTKMSPGQISFSLDPDHHGFFLFPPAERNFISGDKKIQLHGFDIYIDTINSARKVTHYDIMVPDALEFPVFYFDGKRICRY